jgi:integrase
MPRPKRGPIARGSTYCEPQGTVGIRWPENDRRPQRGGFRTDTEAREWFDEHVAPRLRRGGPSGAITLDQFAELYLDRWGEDREERTVRTVRNWLKPARKRFGKWTLSELEGAVDDIADWRKRLPSADARYKSTRALRQLLAAAVRWRYMHDNPAKDIGPNPQPTSSEPDPFTRPEVDAIADELTAVDASLVIVAAETGLRTNEWIALERRDVDRRNPAVAVMRRYASGKLTPYPKTGERSRRRVPLTPRALGALDALPARLDTPILFPAQRGGHINLNNWRARIWTPAVEAAGVRQRGPYALRDTFATEALAGGVPVFEVARLMGSSVEMIERHYGGYTADGEQHLRSLLTARSAELGRKPGVNLASTNEEES